MNITAGSNKNTNFPLQITILIYCYLTIYVVNFDSTVTSM